MNANNTIPEFTSYAEMEAFCDTHDLGEYWEQTEPAEFEMSPLSESVHEEKCVSITPSSSSALLKCYECCNATSSCRI